MNPAEGGGPAQDTAAWCSTATFKGKVSAPRDALSPSALSRARSPPAQHRTGNQRALRSDSAATCRGETHVCWSLARTAGTTSEDSPRPFRAPNWTGTASLFEPSGHLRKAFWHWERNYDVPAFYDHLSEQHLALLRLYYPGWETWKMKRQLSSTGSLDLHHAKTLQKRSMFKGYMLHSGNVDCYAGPQNNID